MVASLTSQWSHPDGKEAGTAQIAAAMLPFMSRVVGWGTSVYSSDDMKAGINCPLLVRAADVLKALLRIDPRGGVFSQGMLTEAFETCLGASGLRETAVMAAMAEGKGLGEWCCLTMYRVRVMLAHIRMKFDSNARGKELRDMFAEMRSGAADGADVQQWSARTSLGHNGGLVGSDF